MADSNGILLSPRGHSTLSGVNLIPTGDVIIPLGTERLFASVDEFDPDGDIYASGLQKVNAKCLAHFGMRPHQVTLLPRDWHDWPGVDSLVEMIRVQLRKSRDWQKDLRSPHSGIEILAPLYAEALRREGLFDFTFIVCFNNPLETLPSNTKDSGEPNDEQIFGLRIVYLLNALANTKGLFRKVMPYWSYVASQSPVPVVLRHAPAVPDFDGWPSLVGDLYGLCQDVSEDADSLNEGKFDSRIEELCDRYRVIQAMTNAVDLPDDKMTFTWADGRAEFAYGPVEGWQSFRALIDAPFGAKIQFDPYQTPCYFWIRKSSWIRLGGTTDAVLKPGPNGILEEVDGFQRLTILGPGAAFLQSQGLAEFEIEYLIQANDVVLKDLILMLHRRRVK